MGLSQPIVSNVKNQSLIALPVTLTMCIFIDFFSFCVKHEVMERNTLLSCKSLCIHISLVLLMAIMFEGCSYTYHVFPTTW